MNFQIIKVESATMTVNGKEFARGDDVEIVLTNGHSLNAIIDKIHEFGIDVLLFPDKHTYIKNTEINDMDNALDYMDIKDKGKLYAAACIRTTACSKFVLQIKDDNAWDGWTTVNNGDRIKITLLHGMEIVTNYISSSSSLDGIPLSIFPTFTSLLKKEWIKEISFCAEESVDTSKIKVIEDDF